MNILIANRKPVSAFYFSTCLHGMNRAAPPHFKCAQSSSHCILIYAQSSTRHHCDVARAEGKCTKVKISQQDSPFISFHQKEQKKMPCVAPTIFQNVQRENSKRKLMRTQKEKFKIIQRVLKHLNFRSHMSKRSQNIYTIFNDHSNVKSLYL